MPKIYRITTLGGDPLTEGAAREALITGCHTDTFRALVQLAESRMEELRQEACAVESHKDGTAAHKSGGASALEDFLLDVATLISSGQAAAKRVKGRAA